jgi:hypothetical protein
VRRAILIALIAAFACALSACGGNDGDGGDREDGGDAGTPAEQRSFVVGIGEQGSAMFADQRFRDLGVKHARLVVPYDSMARRTERELADLWLGEAARAGVEPFITFGHSRAVPEKLPSVAEFRSAFRAFRERYPAVRVYAPWNEINHASQPTARAPRRAAEFYNVVKAECRDCTVLAGDVLDQRGMTEYLRQYGRHLEGEPEIWGLHNYADTNRFRTSGLRDLLRTVEGDVWLTETGGIVKFGRNFPRDEQRAARSIAYAFKLARDNERVKRVYLYNWTGARPTDRFDSGLIAPDGTARPGFDALRAELAR